MKPEITSATFEPVGVLRSHGPLLSEALRRVHVGELAFDPLQVGWIDGAVCDDIDLADPLGPLLAGDPFAATGLALRPWRGADRAVYRALLDDPRVWEHLPEPYPAPLSEALAADLIAASAFEGRHCVRALTAGGVPVGQVRLEYAAGGARHEAEISYWLGQAHWGRGLGRRLVAGAIARAFVNAPALRRLVARVRPANTASRRVLEAAGFAPVDAAGRDSGWLWLGLRRQDRRGINSEESP